MQEYKAQDDITGFLSDFLIFYIWVLSPTKFQFPVLIMILL